MHSRSYKVRNYSAALYLLLAAFIAFVPHDLLPHLSNIATPDRFHEARILAVAFPPAPTTIAASRAQRTWVSDAAKQNDQTAEAGNFFVPPRTGSYTRGLDLRFVHHFHPHICLADCDRAPPRLSFTTI